MKKSVFMDKKAAETLTQSKRTVFEALLKDFHPEESFEAEVAKRNSELLGVLPYMFCFGAYVFENLKELVIDAPEITHYQLGTRNDPIPLSVLYKYTIGPYADQKEVFHAELYRYMTESRKYWLPTETGRFLLDEPIRVVPVSGVGLPVTPKIFYNLVSRQEDGIYKREVKQSVPGVILHYYKPLFEGHFNGWHKGFIKQPPLLYALAREYHQHLSAAEYADFTPVKTMKIFYYLAAHCNYMGEKMTVDMADLLKYVAEYALDGDTIRYTRLPPVLSAFAVLSRITCEHSEGFDFILGDILLTSADWAYADREKPALVTPASARDRFERQSLAVKHHLKKHHCRLELAVTYTRSTDTRKLAKRRTRKPAED